MGVRITTIAAAQAPVVARASTKGFTSDYFADDKYDDLRDPIIAAHKGENWKCDSVTGFGGN